jgi:CelD/BcsL family acetyltransferase involved in cellulose biosynthesis
MTSGTALLGQPAVSVAGSGLTTAVAQPRGSIAVTMTNSIQSVETIWRTLQAGGAESPGQSYDFIALWVKDRGLAARDQVYVVGSIDGQPVALLPLHRRKAYGVRVLSWFPGANVGCSAPVADLARLEALGVEGRAALWDQMTAQLSGADLVYLRCMPERIGAKAGLFDELGQALAVETLYRAEFSTWEECDRVQRSKSRRKHDRQQGERLDAMGAVSFEEIRNGGDAWDAIETMFAQRSARFKAMGIRDCFVRDRLTGFYHDAIARDSGIDVRLHLLRLDGAIVAMRYNIVQGDRMFCLISSMSDDAAIQNGSPGKQCLLRVMQSVFEQGFAVFDMGAGLTDEKRHWCNVQTPLRHHYVALTAWGGAALRVHQGLQRTRKAIKENRALMGLLRTPGQMMHRVCGTTAGV